MTRFLPLALLLTSISMTATAQDPASADSFEREMLNTLKAAHAAKKSVYLHVGGGDFEATGFGPHQLHVRGTVPLPEGLLGEIEALSPRSFTVHARVLLSWSEGTRFGAVLMPFALTGPALLHWRALGPSGAES